LTILGSATENVHDISDESRSVTLSGAWDVADTFELSPRVCARIEGPDIVEPGDTISSTEEVETIVPGDHGVVGTSRWNLSMRWTTIDCTLNESLPPVAGLLQGIEIECDKVVEEEAFNLASKNVYL